MENLLAAAIVLGLASACSVQHETFQRPAPAPTTTAITPDPVQPAGATTITTNPGTGPVVLNNFDPPMRVRQTKRVTLPFVQDGLAAPAMK